MANGCPLNALNFLPAGTEPLRGVPNFELAHLFHMYALPGGLSRNLADLPNLPELPLLSRSPTESRGSRMLGPDLWSGSAPNLPHVPELPHLPNFTPMLGVGAAAFVPISPPSCHSELCRGIVFSHHKKTDPSAPLRFGRDDARWDVCLRRGLSRLKSGLPLF